MRRVALLVPLAALVAGCGSTRYDAAKSVACLKKQGASQATIVPLPKTLKPTGAVAFVRLGPDGELVFYKSDKEAKADGTRIFKKLGNILPGGFSIEQQKNAVLVIPAEQRDDDSKILHCLRS
jgi:hypothetical protein